jgi:poly(A) polymerase
MQFKDIKYALRSRDRSRSGTPYQSGSRGAKQSGAGLGKTALGVLKRLRKHGFQAYFAGGCVRDKLMHRTPDDYDIATSAKPNQVIKLFKKTVATGKVFGVINVIPKPGTQIEVTTFRTEGPYSDGRHPDKVEFSSLENDVLRRDFTVNGMAFDPLENRLVDLVGGQKDLKRKIIRAIGSPVERFKEDKLRMLRAIRFAVQLGFKIEPKTLQAINKLHCQIKVVSSERVCDELKKMLLSKRRAEGIRLMDKTGLLKTLLPEVHKMKGVKQPKEFHPEGDVYVHTLKCLEHLGGTPTFTLAFATLLHDVGKPKTFMITDRIRFHEHERKGRDIAGKICDRFRLSNAEKEKVMFLVDKHMAFKDIEKMRTATLKRLFREPHYAELAELHKADRLASDLDLKPHYYAQRKFKKLSKEELKPKPLINGHDLIRLGLKPGPIFSVILKKAEEAQLEKAVTNKKQALDLAKQVIKEIK